ncbi:MAG: 8-oxo-dGTP diphosphatase MutT [Halioglobus sp.]|nr:8-oxo-dGTP diphosphatase MutT [Halioglobus sp.]
MKEVHVAVGVILDARGRILLTRRAEDAHQGGLWEFPGGKVEEHESLQAALTRELREELGITPARTSPLIEVRHNYVDKQVFLDVHVVWEHAGEASGLEGQPLAWVAVDELCNYDFPAANVQIVQAAQAHLS